MTTKDIFRPLKVLLWGLKVLSGVELRIIIGNPQNGLVEVDWSHRNSKMSLTLLKEALFIRTLEVLSWG